MLGVCRLRNTLVLCLGAAIGFPAVASETAGQWLEKMDKALHEQNYQGTFIYMRGSQLDTIQVVHQFADGKEHERLTSQDGEEREIIRNDDEAICYHAPGEQVDLTHAVPMGPFSHSFSKNLATNHPLYQVSLQGEGRIADRRAVRVRITPRNRDRYGYQLWLDEETGLLLRSNLVNRGRVLEFFQFSEVKIGEPIESAQLLLSLSKQAPQHTLTQSTQELAVAQVKRNWRPAWVPKGFQQVRVSAINGMSFTDGVANLSIFVERSGKAALGDVQTSVGGTVVFSRQIKGSSQQITVVGEVPLATARKVAESIEPVVY
ncbi:MAG: MucB/RseB C-terminal domain-containing protein [Pseudomonadales bacterium]|nr:MucB/RseB C-terminal domain-containing protein [Pseudomonadales bacterium]